MIAAAELLKHLVAIIISSKKFLSILTKEGIDSHGVILGFKMKIYFIDKDT